MCHHRPKPEAVVIPRTLTDLADRIERFTAVIGRTVAWLALAIALVQFALVLARYVFSFGSIWLSQSVIYGQAMLITGAAAWTLSAGGHVRVDVFYAHASARTRAIIDLAGSLLLLLPFMLMLIWLSVPYAARSWAILERSQDVGGIPLVFLLKTLVPLFAALMALQGVAQAIRAASVYFPPPVTPGLGPGVHPSSQDGLSG